MWKSLSPVPPESKYIQIVQGEPTKPNLAIESPVCSPTDFNPSAAQGACFLALKFVQSSTSVKSKSLILIPPPYSTSYPRLGKGVKMSLKIIAASIFLYLSIGCRVIFVHKSTSIHLSQNECSAAIFLYSGRCLPACLINQTGVLSTGSRFSADTILSLPFIITTPNLLKLRQVLLPSLRYASHHVLLQ